jgi:hypothetical protein
MNLSCIIVACSKSGYHREITKQAIVSSGVDCIVVETFPNAPPHPKAKETLFWTKQFNYNACLNFGIEHTNTEYIALCNNDVIFKQGWQKITEIMKANNLLSASPFSEYSQHKHGYLRGNTINYGYWIGHELLGWCIVIHKDIFQIIGKLDESQRFWCSDNAYADQLIANNIQHALICSCVVNHIRGGSKTLNTLSRQQYKELTTDEYNKYSQKEGSHLSEITKY